MKIAISGASGFIGKHLTNYLAERSHHIVSLRREIFKEESFRELIEQMEDCDVLINLAGATINHRWTAAYKRALYKSRVGVTSRLVCALKSAKRRPKVMISTSAVGYYPSVGEYDERDEVRANGFLALLCRDWEEAASKCPADTRLVIARLGVVLAPGGGAMQEMIKPMLRTRFSAVIGSGQQAFPWIALQDVCRAIGFFIEQPETRGVYNLVSPQQITQHHLASALVRAYHVWGAVPVPGIVFRCLLGERAGMLLQGQTVHPFRLPKAGFEYSIPTVETLLRLPDTRTVTSLDLTRYMGRWYEIARYDHSFERGMTNVTATYSLLPDGNVRVENAGYRNGVRKLAVGHAYCPDATQPGRLKVSFFLSFYSDYYVLELDEVNYDYALIGSSSNKYLWILSRTSTLSDEVKETLLSAAANRGYDIKKLMFQ